MRALHGLWLTPSVCLAGFFLLGLVSDAPLAYLAFGLLPASVLSVLSIAVSYWVKRGTDVVARLVWIAHSLVLLALLGALVFVAANTHRDSPSDVGAVLTYTMLIAAFPISVPAVAVMGGAAWALNCSLPTLAGSGAGYARASEIAFLFLAWLVYTVAGYWQWFVLFPSIIVRLRATPRATRTTPTTPPAI
jgi:hypothetical protein